MYKQQLVASKFEIFSFLTQETKRKHQRYQREPAKTWTSCTTFRSATFASFSPSAQKIYRMFLSFASRVSFFTFNLKSFTISSWKSWCCEIGFPLKVYENGASIDSYLLEETHNKWLSFEVTTGTFATIHHPQHWVKCETLLNQFKARKGAVLIK